IEHKSGGDSTDWLRRREFLPGRRRHIQRGPQALLSAHDDTNTGLYLQDSYKVTSRLTLNPGVRWDINPAVREENGLLNRFDVESHSLMFPNSLESYYKIGATTPQIVGLYQAVGVQFKSAAELNKSPQIFPSNKFDIGPRVGFAYRLFDGKKQTILRGGYG